MYQPPAGSVICWCERVLAIRRECEVDANSSCSRRLYNQSHGAREAQTWCQVQGQSLALHALYLLWGRGCSGPPYQWESYELTFHLSLLQIFLCSELSELDTRIERMMMKQDDGCWHCSECDYMSRIKTNIKMHVESRHVVSAGFTCDICQLFCANRKALQNHYYRKHLKKN